MAVRARQLVAVAAVLVALLVAAGCGGTRAGEDLLASNSATAGDDAACGARVINDWAADGVVDEVHRLPCYRMALQSLPEDVRAYTSAVDDIERALFSLHPQAPLSSGG